MELLLLWFTPAFRRRVPAPARDAARLPPSACRTNEGNETWLRSGPDRNGRGFFGIILWTSVSAGEDRNGLMLPWIVCYVDGIRATNWSV